MRAGACQYRHDRRRRHTKRCTSRKKKYPEGRRWARRRATPSACNFAYEYSLQHRKWLPGLCSYIVQDKLLKQPDASYEMTTACRLGRAPGGRRISGCITIRAEEHLGNHYATTNGDELLDQSPSGNFNSSNPIGGENTACDDLEEDFIYRENCAAK